MGKSQEKRNKVHEWEVISENIEYECSVFKVNNQRSLHPEMGEGEFFVIQTPEWVNVVAETEAGHIVLIDQFRHGTQSITTEIPGGMVDPGETPLEAAQRELKEETGYASDQWSRIGVVDANPAIMTNRTHTFLAKNCTQHRRMANSDTFEEIRVWSATPEKVFEMVTKQNITHALVVAALFHYHRWQ